MGLNKVNPLMMTDVYTESEVDNKIAGFKNHIINGKKSINQRGLTSTDNSYNQDRWYKAGNNWYQGIEELSLTTGNTYTLSWTGSATAGYYVGTATSATINSQTFTPIVNGGSFTLIISAGENLWIKFASDATGSTFTNVQLELGSVATPFEQRPYGLELSLCQRYYQTGICYSNQDTSALLHHAALISSPVPMRITPSITYKDLAGVASKVSYNDSGNVGDLIHGGTIDSINYSAGAFRFWRYVAANGTYKNIQFTFYATAEL